jgi:hypothetical protein
MSAGTFNQPQQRYGAQVAGRSNMAVASLVLGIVAMLTFWIWIGGLLFAPLAIVFGVLGRKETRGGAKSGENMATAGLVLGIVAAVMIVPWGIFVASSS